MRQLPLRWYDFLLGRRKYKMLFNELLRVQDNTAVMAAKAKAQESLCQSLSVRLARIEAALHPTLSYHDAEVARKEREKRDRERLRTSEPIRAQYPEKNLPRSMGARVAPEPVRSRDTRDNSGDYHINPALIPDVPVTRSAPAPTCSPRYDPDPTPSSGGYDSGSSSSDSGGGGGGGGGCD